MITVRRIRGKVVTTVLCLVLARDGGAGRVPWVGGPPDASFGFYQ